MLATTIEKGRPARILHVIPSVGHLRGGPSQVIATLCRGLAAGGIEVHVATTDDNGPGRLDVPYGAPVFRGGVTYWYFRRQARFYTFSSSLSRWLGEHVRAYDLVHIHALYSHAPVAAARWSRRRRVPYIIRPLGTLNRWGMRNHHPWMKEVSFRFIESRLLEEAAAIHYTSEQERLEAAELGVKQRSVIIPNPVELPPSLAAPGFLQSRYPQLAGKVLILFLSRLDRKKGLDLLLPAFAKLRAQHPNATLVVAGAGDDAFVNRLREGAARLGIQSDVVWTGFLDENDKQAALADADLFVLPSYSENFGVAVVEAMGHGLPVVVSDQVGIHREVVEAGAGLAVSCGVEELARGLTSLVENPSLRSRMGQNGRRLAQTQFSVEAVIRRVADLYAGILSSAPQAKTA